MSSRPAADQPTTTAFDVLAGPLRRYVLAELLDGGGGSDGDGNGDSSTSTSASAATSASTSVSGAASSNGNSMPIERLVTEVTSKAHDSPIVSDEQCTQTHVALVHHHVPRLEDVGVVATAESDAGTVVEPTDHPILKREWVRRLLEAPVDGHCGSEERLNRTCEVLQSAQRRTVCTVLARQRGRLSVADLATMVAARSGDEDRRLVDVSETEWAHVKTDLIHSHLPALAEAELVEYDRESDAETVAIAPDTPQWNTDWLVESPLGEIPDLLGVASRPDAPIQRDGGAASNDATYQPSTRPRAPAAANEPPSNTSACWTIESSEDVLARGHELADGAADELVVTVPDGRLHQRCLERWRAAADRGVDVYVGSRSAQVRETVAAAVPDATVCEPQLDWINFPTERLDHGRVVLADREQVMLVSVDDAAPNATAITGEGSENVLVSLLCKHLGPRLDRLASRRDDHEPTDGPSPLPM